MKTLKLLDYVWCEQRALGTCCDLETDMFVLLSKITGKLQPKTPPTLGFCISTAQCLKYFNKTMFFDVFAVKLNLLQKQDTSVDFA